MAELGMITTQQAADGDAARDLGLNLADYFSRRRERYFLDYVKDELIKQYGPQTVKRGGLKVYTTIDLKKQQQARDAIADQLGGIGPSSAIVTIDPKNGDIVAMASSADYGESKFNLAAQGHRQPGSTFKMMALMTALRDGRRTRTRRATRRCRRRRSTTRRCGAAVRDQDLRRHRRRHHEPRRGDARLRQLGLHPARARPRPGQGQARRRG